MVIVYKIPLKQGSQKFSVNLSGVVYHLSIIWRDMWYLDISDKDKNSIISGVAMTPNTKLLEQFQHVFAGDLVLIETAEQEYPSYQSMGKTLNLYYVSDYGTMD